MAETLMNAGMVLLVGAAVWVVTWIGAGILLTGSTVDEVCPSGAQYERGLKDWHMAGPWPIATDYKCGEW